ncbi:MAG: cyclase family protein [Dethiosulfatibacter sp.]|nr:cyclase family protein [Dethiosulfatibacter sp.]
MYIDLTHTIEQNMPFYPGTGAPKIKQKNTVDIDGFAEVEISFYSHTGTHMDAPAHMVKGGMTLDEYPIEHFFGKAFLLDLREGIPYLDTLIQLKPELESVDFIILYTGWSDYWGEKRYFVDFPILPLEHVNWLMSLGIKGFGVDAISIDPVDTTTFENHHAVFSKGGTITENLTNLNAIISPFFDIIMLPLKNKNSDGISIRAVAVVDA